MENNQYTVASDDEIDLKELFLSLWSHKILIAFITGAFVFGAGFYALTADKVYSTRSTFTLAGDGNSGGLLGSLGGELGGLAALAGISAGGDSSAEALIERVTSREFILEVAGELDLQGDAFFNGYDPKAQEPAWKATLKQLLGMNNAAPDPNKIADWNVIEAYKEFITIETTSGGAISVAVKHEIPERAAEIANHIVGKIITLTTDENIENVDEKLRYLSQTLADASEELEDAQDAMKTYSLENSAQAIESFAVGSVMMDDMRAQRDRTVEQLQAIMALKTAISAGQTTMQEYMHLREAYPLLDQASFRRILGLSEVISAWTWPTAQSVSQVEDSIRDRIAALEGEITKLEADALRYAASAEEFARLTRDLKVAEATYTVLIEQVKSQSLVAGFTPDNSKIIEIADVPLVPSEPKRTLIVALGLVLGLFFGSAVALVLSMRKGVYYS
ncbi:MAG: GNVR domain-containing protein, partial [Marivita sp.]